MSWVRILIYFDGRTALSGKPDDTVYVPRFPVKGDLIELPKGRHHFRVVEATLFVSAMGEADFAGWVSLVEDQPQHHLGGIV